MAEYNLGCMYARAHDKGAVAQREGLADRALQHLARGLEGRGAEILAWAAKKDPALDSLRKGETAARFAALMDSLQPPQARRPAVALDVWKVSISN